MFSGMVAECHDGHSKLYTQYWCEIYDASAWIAEDVKRMLRPVLLTL